MKNPPIVYLIAGSNGSGKTTFAKEFLPDFIGSVDFINADLVAQGLSPFDPNKMLIRSSRLVLERIRELYQARKTFAFETTCSGLSYARLLKNMQADGYRIEMFYLWIPSSALALERIKKRVLEGGHDVSETIVNRRFKKTLWNLFHLYLPLLDYLMIIDNSSSSPNIIAEMKGKMDYIENQDLFESIKREAKFNA